jgi:hypothetical protein
VSARLTLGGPGLGWLPRGWRTRAGWATVGRFALFGPLVGGAPYAVFVVTLPFIYLFGLLPAVLAGLLFAAWLHVPAQRVPNAAWRFGVGALCGAAGCAVAAWWLARSDGAPLGWAFAWLALHGIPSGAVLGAWHGRARRGFRPLRPASLAPARSAPG